MVGLNEERDFPSQDFTIKPIQASTSQRIYYDKDIDEGIRLASDKIRPYESIVHPNDVKNHALDFNSQNRLNQGRNATMREAIQNSLPIEKPVAFDDYVSSEDEEEQEQQLMNDDYLVMKNLNTSMEEETKPEVDSNVITADSVKLQQSKSQTSEMTSKNVEGKKERKLDTKTESTLIGFC